MQTETMSERDQSGAARPKRVRTRTCVGCGNAVDAVDLLRVVLGPRGEDGGSPVAIDLASGAHGRGAHIHATRDCLARAAKSGLARSFKAKIATTEAELVAQIEAACDRRVAGLITGAHRARMVAVGADAANDALKRGAPLVIVAKDAASVVEHGPVAEAIAGGRAIAWKDKVTIGGLFGRAEVAVLAVTNESVAAEIARARRTADAIVGGGGSTRGEACRSREAR
jgi:predicted RNA-binding protein YlxR (DUF448 family)